MRVVVPLFSSQKGHSMAGPQFVYVMKGLSKTYPGGKQVLKDIWLSFYPGAKIGIVGVNGSGKSTLMRIMAGQDKEFTGEAWSADGVRMGYLPQEPQLDASKDVLGNVMEGVAKKRRCSTATTRSLRITPTKPPTRWRSCRTRSRRRACGISTARSRWRWTRCAVPIPTPMCRSSPAASAAASLCANCCSMRPTSSCSTSRPTISTRNRWRGSSTRCANTRAHHPRHP